MKKLAFISASALLCTSVLVSCTSNKMAVNTFDDNLYFMSADVKKATENAVANNQPATFQNLANSTVVPQENFSSKNVNPDYLARYGQLNTSSGQDVVYFEENQGSVTGATPNIDIYNSYTISNLNSGWGNTAFNYGFSPFGMGMSPYGMGMMGFSPFGMGMYDPFWSPGWRPGFNMGLSFGMGRPFYNPFNPYMGYGGFYDPFFGSNAWGSPWGWNRPIYTTGPIIILPGNENPDRRVVYGARPSRGASMSNGGGGVVESIGTPNTARSQARENVANSSGASPRRLDSPESPRSATRDFSTSQNDYYSSGSSTGRGYNSSPSRSTYNAEPDRTTSSPSYNRSSGANTGTRSTSSYGRSESSGYNYGNTPSRSNTNSSSFSAPSRSSAGESFSAPSRSSSGSSGSSSSGGSRGRGN